MAGQSRDATRWKENCTTGGAECDQPVQIYDGPTAKVMPKKKSACVYVHTHVDCASNSWVLDKGPTKKNDC